MLVRLQSQRNSPTKINFIGQEVNQHCYLEVLRKFWDYARKRPELCLRYSLWQCAKSYYPHCGRVSVQECDYWKNHSPDYSFMWFFAVSKIRNCIWQRFADRKWDSWLTSFLKVSSRHTPRNEMSHSLDAQWEYFDCDSTY